MLEVLDEQLKIYLAGVTLLEDTLRQMGLL